MTALNFILEKDAVCIAMDTLATCDDDKSPQSFASKMFPVPHLNGVICGTGIFEFVGKWFLFVNSAFVVKNMIHLDQYAPKELRKLYAEVWKDADLPKASSTIYHFGYDERLKEFVGFAYRSESNFESEILKTNHAGYKPPPSMLVNGDNPELECLPDSFIKIMTVQKKEDEKRPFEERVGIGGDIHFLHMCKNPESQDGLPILMQIQPCHRFSDYEEMYQMMLRNLAEKE